jgi:predicted SnoaL-like aldol condensation-catalyzing enzyme
VLEAFDTLFNKRDYAAAERFWSDHYIQHSAHIAPGRDGLFNLIRTLPDTLRYENQLIVAEGDYVIAHGRFGKRTARWAPKISDRGPSTHDALPAASPRFSRWPNTKC